MSKIIGNTTTTPVPRSDWSQTDKTKADFIRHKPELGSIAEKDTIDKVDLSLEVQTSLEEIDNKANVRSLSTEEYEALELADKTDENTLYVLTDAEEGVSAENVTYENTNSGLVAENVQDAIDELKQDTDTLVKTTTDTVLADSFAGGLKVNSVSGASEQTTYTGKNIWYTSFTSQTDLAEKKNGEYKTLANVSTSYPLGDDTNKIHFKMPLGTFTLSAYSEKFTEMYVELSDGTIWQNGETKTFTDTVYIETVRCKAVELTTGTYYWQLQIEEGTTATEYEPYVGGIPAPNPDYPQEIKSVELAGVKTCGNLLDTNNIVNYAYALDILKKEAGVTCTIDVSKGYNYSGFCERKALEVGKTYTISFDIKVNKVNFVHFRPEIGNIPKIIAANNFTANTFQHITFSATATKSILLFSFNTAGFEDSENFDVEIKNIMLVEGDTEYPYEPYQETAVIFSQPITLRGINDVKDRIVKQDGVWGVERNIVEKVFDGTENWISYSNGIEANYFGLNIGEKDSVYSEIISNHFKKDIITSSTTSVGICIINSTSLNAARIAVRPYNVESMTASSWKDYLSEQYANGTPMIAVYGLVTPTFEPLPTADQLALNSLATFDGITHITLDSEIEPSFEVEYGMNKVGGYALQGLLDSGIAGNVSYDEMGDGDIPPISITQGGTGAVSAEEALINLGGVDKNKIVNLSANITATMSTTMTNVGSITIPANCLVSLKAHLVWNNTKPVAIGIGLSPNGANYASVEDGIVNGVTDNTLAKPVVSLSVMTTEETTYYIYAQYATAGSNIVTIDGYYIQL